MRMISMKRKKAQASVEFLMLAGFLFIIFIFLIMIVGERTTALHKERRQRTLEEVGWIIETEIDLAENALEGYRRQFELPGVIDSYNYYLDYESSSGSNVSELRIKYNDDLKFKERHIVFIDNDIKNVDEIKPGKNNITKKDSTIRFNPS